MAFPEHRSRRLRRTPALRRLVGETRVDVDDLVAPLFVKEGIDAPEPVTSMPGVLQHTQESLRKEVRALADLGIPAVVLFGVPAAKDATGSGADARDGVVQVALRSLRDEVGDDLVLIADNCLDEYTDHGHCGVLTADGEVDNDATIERYAEIAVAQADAGADVVAPSGMMDGQVGAIRVRARFRPRTAARRSSPTRRSTPRRCTARSATPPSARRSSATAAATRWTRATPARPSTRPRSTSPRAPTWSW